MGENCVNEIAINMDVGIGEELDYEANDNIEHEEEAAEKLETNQHERIVKEVANSDHESSATAERTTDNSGHNEDKKEEKSNQSESKKEISSSLSDSKPDQEKKKEETKDVKEKQVASSNARSVCKPCNLVFENTKWLERHNESGDHTHVIKGFNPGGGKYYCYLCWLGFEHTEMMLHHIKRSEHITRARRRGVSDVYIKPSSGKSNEKPTPQPAKSGDRVPHRSGSQSKKPSSHTHRPSSQSQKPSSVSHRLSSSHSHRSRSPLRIRLSDYYEVSSVGHCDTSGVRLKTLANGVHKSSRDAVSSVKSSHKKDKCGSKPVDKVKNSIVTEEKSESSARVTIPVNGSSDPEPRSVTLNENHDLNSSVSTEPPDGKSVGHVTVNQANDAESGKSVTERENVAKSVDENSEAPDSSAMET